MSTQETPVIKELVIAVGILYSAGRKGRNVRKVGR